MKKYSIFIIVLIFFIKAYGQNLGGSATYNFLKLPQSSTVSALGGTIVALNQNNLSVVQQNPALLQRSMHNQLHTSMQFLYGGIKNMNVSYALNKQQKNITVAGAIQYVNYGTNSLNNANGNNIGNFSANDYALQLSASKQYLQKWYYGSTVKLIGSNYGSIQSYAIAVDAGISYKDTAKLLNVGLVFKNVGTQLKAYTEATKESLPFDLQLGLSKKLKNAPIQFVATITNAHQFDIRYADTTFDNDINNSLGNQKFTIDKLFRHLIIATQIFPSKNVELSVSYNYLRRKELGLYNIGTGVTGFSFGASVLLKAYQFSVAQSYFQNNKPYYQVGITIDFKNLHN